VQRLRQPPGPAPISPTCDFSPPDGDAHIVVRNLTMAYGDFVLQRDLDFTINRGDIFIVMGGSGSGKSTLLNHLLGLNPPAHGEVLLDGQSLWDADQDERDRMLRKVGVLYQSGALWSSMTIEENIALPLGEYTKLSPRQIKELVALKLALVGLSGFEDYFPSQISGGMRKRAGLARAIALDPEILFFDEPSAGLDPVNARRLDDLILDLRANLGATFVVVTHELDSIFAIGNNSVFLDIDAKTQIARGDPNRLREECDNPTVRAFLTRGREGLEALR
jgi:phospholipid/cholesterol/gamma-HCH transport system ATP-binding protein